MYFSLKWAAFLVFWCVCVEVRAQGGGPRNITWVGYNWTIRDQAGGGPGPNNWDANNVWIDANGFLHLKMGRSSATGTWRCAELSTTVDLGFGTYRWFVEGPIDKLDPNVVFGLFTYGLPDGANEIDIEFSKWSDAGATAPDLSYTTYPHTVGVAPADEYKIRVVLTGNFTTHSFTWKNGSVSFLGQHGHQTSPSINVFSSYRTPTSFASAVPFKNAKLHMNLWGFQGRAPNDGLDVEMVIRGFKYTAA